MARVMKHLSVDVAAVEDVVVEAAVHPKANKTKRTKKMPVKKPARPNLLILYR